MKKLVMSVALLSLSTFGAPHSIDVNNFSPGGEIISANGDEIKIKTKSNTVIEVEFTKGELSEASGDDINRDIFTPGNELLSLDKIKEGLIKDKKLSLYGDWSLEKEDGEWVYELDGVEASNKVELKVSAVDSSILKKEIDS